MMLASSAMAPEAPKLLMALTLTIRRQPVALMEAKQKMPLAAVLLPEIPRRMIRSRMATAISKPRTARISQRMTSTILRVKGIPSKTLSMNSIKLISIPRKSTRIAMAHILSLKMIRIKMILRARAEGSSGKSEELLAAASEELSEILLAAKISEARYLRWGLIMLRSVSAEDLPEILEELLSTLRPVKQEATKAEAFSKMSSAASKSAALLLVTSLAA